MGFCRQRNAIFRIGIPMVFIVIVLCLTAGCMGMGGNGRNAGNFGNSYGSGSPGQNGPAPDSCHISFECLETYHKVWKFETVTSNDDRSKYISGDGFTNRCIVPRSSDPQFNNPNFPDTTGSFQAIIPGTATYTEAGSSQDGQGGYENDQTNGASTGNFYFSTTFTMHNGRLGHWEINTGGVDWKATEIRDGKGGAPPTPFHSTEPVGIEYLFDSMQFGSPNGTCSSGYNGDKFVIHCRYDTDTSMALDINQANTEVTKRTCEAVIDRSSVPATLTPLVTPEVSLAPLVTPEESLAPLVTPEVTLAPLVTPEESLAPLVTDNP
jgi:hypothetical protein